MTAERVRLPHGTVGRFGGDVAMGVVSVDSDQQATVQFLDVAHGVPLRLGEVRRSGAVAVELVEAHPGEPVTDGYIVVAVTDGSAS